MPTIDKKNKTITYTCEEFAEIKGGTLTAEFQAHGPNKEDSIHVEKVELSDLGQNTVGNLPNPKSVKQFKANILAINAGYIQGWLCPGPAIKFTDETTQKLIELGLIKRKKANIAKPKAENLQDRSSKKGGCTIS